jgi:alkylation response protein AidB-like acyl-CoA dehydrogenase
VENGTLADARSATLADIRETVAGVVARFDRAYFLRQARCDGTIDELWQELADKDLLAVGVPESLGGVDGGLSGMATVMEEMSAVGVPPILYVLMAFSRESLIRHGSPQQIEDHVARTLTGERKICFAVTEPEAGTNSFAMRTRARRTGDGGFVINGQKAFISAADEADHMLLIARTAPPGDPVGRDRGFSLFIVDAATPGIERSRMAIEWHAPERQYEIFLADVEVPASALIGEEGKGFQYLFDSLNGERVLIAAWAAGLGRYALGKAVAYAKQRAPFGTPIGGYQAVQHPLALAYAHLEAARLLTYAAAAEYDDGLEAGPKANMAKLLASTAANEALDVAIQTHGGHAFVTETDVSTLWPMIRTMRTGPINNESILNYIGQHVLGLPRSFEVRSA